VSFIQTYTGRRVDPLAVRPDDVHLLDIAHALAYSSRYNGHAKKFYSIAQHSVLVSLLLERQEFTTDTQLWGLMHDAAEAYLGDVVTPLKAALGVSTSAGLEAFAELERQALDAIAEGLGLPAHFAERIIKNADRELLACEAEVLIVGDLTAWRLEFKPGALVVDPWTAEESEQKFLARWLELRALREEAKAEATA
jgi:5'-deoxynucleotidase YfbR-like HD superfamily hydrolase